MPGNTFGQLFKLTSFGESHGEAIGGIIDGCPAGLTIDYHFIQNELDRRKPGQSKLTTPRTEEDKVEFLSGIFKDKTLGTPIGFIIKNKDSRPNDYKSITNTYRPSHADYVYDAKYGNRDYRGGGRSSARETAVRVVAGAIAKLLLKKYKVSITAYTSQIGNILLQKKYQNIDVKKIETSLVRCPDKLISDKMIKEIERVRNLGDSLGGIISCVIKNVPVGLGEPIFDKLHADIGKAMLSINAVKGFDYGSGFEGVRMKGSEHNDAFYFETQKIKTKTNFSGGIQGGISNGENIYFRVAFKPVASITHQQLTINSKKEKTAIQIKGRHDPCVVPRAVPIVEAMAALVLVDFLFKSKTNKYNNI